MDAAPEKFKNEIENSEAEDCKCDVRHITKAHWTLSSAVQILSQAPIGATGDFLMGKREMAWEQYFRKSNLAFRDPKSLISVLDLMESSWSTRYDKHSLLCHLYQPFLGPLTVSINAEFMPMETLLNLTVISLKHTPVFWFCFVFANPTISLALFKPYLLQGVFLTPKHILRSDLFFFFFLRTPITLRYNIPIILSQTTL